MKRILHVLFGLSIMAAGLYAQSSGFYAFHTRLENPNLDAIEAQFREDAQQYRDIVVHLEGKGEFIFSAAQGYKPYWQTTEGVFEIEDMGPREMDKECMYSFARLLEENEEKIVVHWRYYPTLSNETFAAAVHEYFEIDPGGKVRRRVVPAREKLDEYLDPGNVTVEVLHLESGGIRQESLVPASLINEPGKPVPGTAVAELGSARPVLWLSFDEGLKTRESRYTTVERVSNAPLDIHGGTALWKKGISGTCLAFDGYHSSVSVPASRAPEISDALSVEAWVALGAYPWNDVPVIHQSLHMVGPEVQEDEEEEADLEVPDKKGYYLGIDADGRPFFDVGGERVSFGKELEMESYRWYHLAGTCGGGKIRLYLNGKEVAAADAKGDIDIPETDLLVGLNNEAYRMRVSEWHRNAEQNLPAYYGVEGLIDEVMVYDRVLTAGEVLSSYEKISGPPSTADLEPRILPGEVDGNAAEQFGAYYTMLRYHDLWDQMWRLSETPDVAVRFDLSPAAVTYWHGQNYAAGWVTENNRWMADQSCEDWGPHGCAEHMSDKQCRHAHIRIIENTPARSVIHWRYRSVDVGYQPCEIEDYCWTDEYHTFYPDGAAVRRVAWNLYGYPSPGWQDIQIFMQPQTTAADHLHIDAMSMANLDGETEVLNYADGDPDVSLDDALIQMVNFKSEYKVFMIAPPGTKFETWSDPFVNRWDHWPVGQYPSDGRDAVALDRVAHAALSASNIVFTGNMAIYGLTNLPVSALVPLAKSWNYPPPIVDTKGCEFDTYKQAERAYSIMARQNALEFTLEGSQDMLIHNPCFVIENWNSDQIPVVSIDGSEVPAGDALRMGIERNTLGHQKLVIWMQKEAKAPLTISLAGARPDVEAPSPAESFWELPPQLDESAGISALMRAAETTDENGVSYFFECLTDTELSSGWQTRPEYLATGLRPNQEYSFRVRARDHYHNLTEYSEAASMRTGDAPAPQAHWKFDQEGSKFDGKDQVRIEEAAELNTEADFSWAMWIRTTESGALMGKTWEADFDDGFRFFYINEDGRLVFETYFAMIESGTPVNDGTWKHVALTVDVTAGHDVVTIYIDGERSVQQTANLKAHRADHLPVAIGYFNDESPEDGSGGFRGVMNEVRWYNYVLGPGHVRDLYEME